MTKLTDLFLSVKEENLTKYQLEDFYQQMSSLYADMHLRMGELEKQQALFMLNDPEKTNALMERLWKGSKLGLEKIQLKASLRATSSHLKSLKSRLFQTY